MIARAIVPDSARVMEKLDIFGASDRKRSVASPASNQQRCWRKSMTSARLFDDANDSPEHDVVRSERLRDLHVSAWIPAQISLVEGAASSTSGYLQRGGHGCSVADEASRLVWAISKHLSRSSVIARLKEQVPRSGWSALLSAHCRAIVVGRLLLQAKA